MSEEWKTVPNRAARRKQLRQMKSKISKLKIQQNERKGNDQKPVRA